MSRIACGLYRNAASRKGARTKTDRLAELNIARLKLGNVRAAGRLRIQDCGLRGLRCRVNLEASDEQRDGAFSR
jgi:hypothetical protein